MSRSKEQYGSKRPTKRIAEPSDLAARFREWQRLRRQVRDFEQAASHNTETIERHEQIEKHRK
jgi:hypothetical protein